MGKNPDDFYSKNLGIYVTKNSPTNRVICRVFLYQIDSIMKKYLYLILTNVIKYDTLVLMSLSNFTNKSPNKRRFKYMKATGIVRRIDDLGRVVIPKEIRRTMRIKEGDPLQTTLTVFDRFCVAIFNLNERIELEKGIHKKK